MHYTFDVFFGAIACRPFGKLGKRAGFGYEGVFQFATHGFSNTAERAECDAIVGFGLFELLDGLSARVNASAYVL
jgi:hypothetical protein